jgi:hypothetical protein
MLTYNVNNQLPNIVMLTLKYAHHLYIPFNKVIFGQNIIVQPQKRNIMDKKKLGQFIGLLSTVTAGVIIGNYAYYKIMAMGAKKDAAAAAAVAAAAINPAAKTA